MHRNALKLALLLVVLGACSRGDPSKCSYWSDLLDTDNKETEAIKKLGDMKCDSEIDKLAARFSKSLYRADILKTLQGFGGNGPTTEASLLEIRAKVAPVVRAALKDREASGVATQLVQDWQIKDAVKDIEALMVSPQNPGARADFLETLLSFTKPQDIVKTLVYLVGEDPTTQGVAVNQRAATELSKIDWGKVAPEVKKEAIDRLITAFFMKDANGDSCYQAARAAVDAIGPEAGPALVEALRGKHALLNQVAQTYAIPKWQHRDGPQLVEVLWDVGDKTSAPAIIESMARAGAKMPPEVALLEPKKQQEWQDTNSNRMVVGALVLAFLRNNDVIPKAKDVLLRKQPWAVQFLQTANALAFMGTKEATAALFDVFHVLLARGDTENAANLVTAMSLGLTPEFLAQYQTDVVAAKEEMIKETATDPHANAYFSIVSTCKAELACYTKMLQDELPKLGDLYKELSEAIKKINDMQTKIGEDKKPVRKEFTELKAQIEKYQKIIEDFKKDPKAAKEKARIEEYNKAVGEFNGLVDKHEILVKKFEELDKQIEAPTAAARGLQTRFFGLAKVVLTLAALDGAEKDEVFDLVTDVFHKSNPMQYGDFRQQAFMYIERFSTPARLEKVKKLREAEAATAGAQYYVLRLQFLIARLERIKS